MSAAIIDIYHAAPTAEPVQRRALYDGKLCAVSATAASKNFGQTVRHAIGRELEIAIDAFDLRHPQLQQAETYRQLAPIRQWLKESKESKMLVVDWLTDILGDVDQYAIDYPRLRMLPPAQCATQPGPAMFMMHRDVWYANSQSQINVWMPLHALDKRQSFAFYPHWFFRQIFLRRMGEERGVAKPSKK